MLKQYCVHYKTSPIDVEAEDWGHFWCTAMDEDDAVDQCANYVWPNEIYFVKTEDVTE